MHIHVHVHIDILTSYVEFQFFALVITTVHEFFALLSAKDMSSTIRVTPSLNIGFVIDSIIMVSVVASTCIN